jgi:hypothetical protein
MPFEERVFSRLTGITVPSGILPGLMAIGVREKRGGRKIQAAETSHRAQMDLKAVTIGREHMGDRLLFGLA